MPGEYQMEKCTFLLVLSAMVRLEKTLQYWFSNETRIHVYVSTAVFIAISL